MDAAIASRAPRTHQLARRGGAVSSSILCPVGASVYPPRAGESSSFMGQSDPIDGFVAAVRGNLGRLRGDAPDPGVVAVSGGADSVALLCALAADPPVG